MVYGLGPFGVIWVMPQSVANLFASWQGPFGRRCNIDLWRAIPHCVLWCLWQEKNIRCFEGTEQSILEIKSLLHSLFDWCSVFCSFHVQIFLLCLIIVIYDLDILLSMYTPGVPRSFLLMIFCYLSKKQKSITNP